MLAGCQPYWVQDIPDYQLQRVEIVRTSQAEMEQRCALNIDLLGCAIRLTNGVTQIILGPKAGNCQLRHELLHAAGWNHDARLLQRVDCGEGV